jgi:hypothetical protein
MLEKNKKRAQRRADRARIKLKVKDYYGGVHKDNPRHIGIMIDTQTPCSCFMCGNPRKYYGRKTFQEIKAQIEDDDAISG